MGTKLDVHDARLLALGAGDFCVAVHREVVRMIATHRGNPRALFEAGIQELQRRQLMHASEIEPLRAICAGERGATRPRELFQAWAIDPESSPVALALASALSKLSELEALASKDGVIARTRISPEQGMLGGALLGAGVGGLAGGPFGAVLGATVGLVVGCTVGVCDTVQP